MRRKLEFGARGATGLAFFFVTSTGLSALAQTSAPAAPAGSTTPAASAAPAGSASATPANASATPASSAAPKGSATPAGSASAPTAGGPAVPIPDKPAMDGATYTVRLRDLEARVDELKDQIRRSHTRLALLSDTILSGGAAGSRAEVVFHNEMSNAFRLTRALFVVDGAIQYNRQDETGALADQKEIPIFSGSIPPGDHTVQVVLNFQGSGFGVFTYLRGYKFEVKSAHSFTAVEGKTMSLQATALEKGGVTTPLADRPAVDWSEKVAGLAPGGAGGGPGTPTVDVKSQGAQTAPGSASGSISVGGGK